MAMMTKKTEAMRQHGGALVESLLIFGVLTTFMIGIPMMGTLIDLKQTTIQASRYSAWEKTVHVNPGDVEDKVDERFFQDASAPITTTGTSELTYNHLWGEMTNDNAGGSAPGSGTGGGGGGAPVDQNELELYQQARVTVLNGSITSVAAETGGSEDGEFPIGYEDVANVVKELGQFISPDGWGDGDPIGNGLVQANIQVQVETNTFLTGMTSSCGGAGCVDETTAILIDGWSAGDTETIRERVHGFVPTNRLEQVGNFVSNLKAIPMLGDLEHLEDAFGCVKTAVLPGKTFSDPLPPYTLAGDELC